MTAVVCNWTRSLPEQSWPKFTQLKDVLSPGWSHSVALTCALDEAMDAAAAVWWRWCPRPGCCGCFWASPQGVMTSKGYCGSHGPTQSLQREMRLSSPSPQRWKIGLWTHSVCLFFSLKHKRCQRIPLLQQTRHTAWGNRVCLDHSDNLLLYCMFL